MGVIIISGDLLKSPCKVYVNATNASGVMGAGIAKAFRDAFPEYYAHYMREYSAGNLSMGVVHTFWTRYDVPAVIASIHTMKGPGENADMVAIEHGLTSLRDFMKANKLTSAAIPALGCGIGGGDFNEIERLVLDVFGTDDTFDIELYAPR